MRLITFARSFSLYLFPLRFLSLIIIVPVEYLLITIPEMYSPQLKLLAIIKFLQTIEFQNKYASDQEYPAIEHSYGYGTYYTYTNTTIGTQYAKSSD